MAKMVERAVVAARMRLALTIQMEKAIDKFMDCNPRYGDVFTLTLELKLTEDDEESGDGPS